MRKLIIKREYLIVASFLGVHLLLGVGSAFSSLIAKAWGAIPILLGTYYIIKSRNRNNEAVYWTAYYAALEVLLRVTNGTVGYEMGKYAAIFFMVLGELLNHNSNKNNKWILFCFLLTPSLLITDWSADNIGELIRFTLSGPVLLAVSAYYFSGRTIEWKAFIKILRVIILPLFALAIVLILKTPNISTIEFRSASNFATSGGFGPVHVSSVLGLGLLIILLCLFTRQNIFGNKWIDLIIWILLLYRALLTFSRSGIYASIVIGGLIITAFLLNRQSRKNFRKIFLFTLIAISAIIFIWSKVNSLTGGMAYNRYTGRNTLGEKTENISTNRNVLLKQDFEMFLDNPLLGIGAGMTTIVRNEKYNNRSSSHTEYARLLTEHGLIGIFLLLLIISITIAHFKETNGLMRYFFMLFAGYSLLIMVPGSTRTALPLFVFGLAFIRINEEN